MVRPGPLTVPVALLHCLAKSGYTAEFRLPGIFFLMLKFEACLCYVVSTKREIRSLLHVMMLAFQVQVCPSVDDRASAPLCIV